MDTSKILKLYSELKESAVNNLDTISYLIDIEKALDELKPRHKFVLTKICIEGYTQSEAAAMLGITKSTINGVYHNALTQFERNFNYGSN